MNRGEGFRSQLTPTANGVIKPDRGRFSKFRRSSPIGKCPIGKLLN
jgi:hypothetical protein